MSKLGADITLRWVGDRLAIETACEDTQEIIATLLTAVTKLSPRLALAVAIACASTGFETQEPQS